MPGQATRATGLPGAQEEERRRRRGCSLGALLVLAVNVPIPRGSSLYSFTTLEIYYIVVLSSTQSTATAVLYSTTAQSTSTSTLVPALE